MRLHREGGRIVDASGAPGRAALFEQIGALVAVGATHYGPPLPEEGFARPRARVVVTRTDGAPAPRSYEILVGAPAGEGDDANVHARRADLAVGFLIAPDVARALLGDHP